MRPSHCCPTPSQPHSFRAPGHHGGPGRLLTYPGAQRALSAASARTGRPVNLYPNACLARILSVGSIHRPATNYRLEGSSPRNGSYWPPAAPSGEKTVVNPSSGQASSGHFEPGVAGHARGQHWDFRVSWQLLHYSGPVGCGSRQARSQTGAQSFYKHFTCVENY